MAQFNIEKPCHKCSDDRRHTKALIQVNMSCQVSGWLCVGAMDAAHPLPRLNPKTRLPLRRLAAMFKNWKILTGHPGKLAISERIGPQDSLDLEPKLPVRANNWRIVSADSNSNRLRLSQRSAYATLLTSFVGSPFIV